eukprot:1813105-Alexandrium_andersonii.AAC.1
MANFGASNADASTRACSNACGPATNATITGSHNAHTRTMADRDVGARSLAVGAFAFKWAGALANAKASGKAQGPGHIVHCRRCPRQKTS